LSSSIALWEEDSTFVNPFSTILVVFGIIFSLSCEVIGLSTAIYNICKKRKDKKITHTKMQKPFFPFFPIPLGDAPPSSLMDSTASPKVKIVKGEEVGVHSLTHSTLKVEGCVGVPGWD
jgi:hypothetical protein